MEDFADLFAADDVGEDLKSFLSPDPVDAEWAPLRPIAKDHAAPVAIDQPSAMSTP